MTYSLTADHRNTFAELINASQKVADQVSDVGGRVDNVSCKLDDVKQIIIAGFQGLAPKSSSGSASSSAENASISNAKTTENTRKRDKKCNDKEIYTKSTKKGARSEDQGEGR